MQTTDGNSRGLQLSQQRQIEARSGVVGEALGESRVAAIPTADFDTTCVDPEDEWEAWRCTVGAYFDVERAGAEKDFGYRAYMTAAHLGSAMMALTGAESQEFRRDSRRLAADDMDHFLVQLFVKGGGTMADRPTVVTGDLLVIDLQQEHCMMNTDFENLSIVLPRDLKPDLTLLLERMHDRSFSRTDPLARLLGDGLLKLWRELPHMTQAQANLALQGSLGLLQAWITQDKTVLEEQPPAVADALCAAIRRHIEKNLDQTLTPESLTRTFRISRASLYRIFAPYGGISRYVRERRLLRAARLLTGPAPGVRSTGAIALDVGFTSAAHFSREFRSRFGCTPTQFRDVARETLDAKEGGESEPWENTVAKWLRGL